LLTAQERAEYAVEWGGLPKWAASKFCRRDSFLDFDEVVSAAQVGLVRALNQWDRNHGSKFSTFAASACLHAALGEAVRQRSRKHRRRISLDRLVARDRDLLLIDTIQGREPDPLSSIIDAEDEALLLREVEKLGPRSAGILRGLVAGKPLQELGEHWGISRERVRQLAEKAKEKLARNLALPDREPSR